MLAVRDVTKTFARATRPALSRLSFDARAGEITGIVGPDGAGKTTLLRLAAGLLVPDEGSLTMLGLDSVRETTALRERIGSMPQQFGLYQDLTVQENLDLYADLRGVTGDERRASFERLLAMTDLAPFTARRAGALSGGMKQKLGLACALVRDPEGLLLDEPTVGVDPVSRRDLWTILYRLVDEHGLGVVVATSYLDEADRCHRVVVLDEGAKRDEGPPRHFHDQVRGRVFAVTPSPASGPRRLQSRLAHEPSVLDATIRSGRVRCVLASSDPTALRAAVDDGDAATSDQVAPDFESAFMAMWRRHGEALPTGRAGAASGASTHDARETVIEVRDLCKRFGTFEAVKHIGFAVRRGEVFGLLGPNGAGKTTTFRMLCGLTRASDGELSVAGLDLRRSPALARARLGYMAQAFSLYRDLTVQQNLAFYAKAYGLSGRRLRERLDWALDEFDLRERRDDKTRSLPQGYKQRLAMATAMLHEPDILFLDEPTSGADPLARREFWLRINGFAQQGVTVVVTTHFMEEAEYCDRMLIMSRGTELAQGTPAEIRALAAGPETPDPSIADAFIALAEGAARPRAAVAGRAP
ncbi:MAG: ABC transporter ATP-binding protein [Planctomycetes bacterium]|nr:ABC transporter ATP-binding protein [Planctomycetota bacterium]